MKVLSLFSGIGAFEKALSNLGIPFNLVGYCEIDKYASKSYSAIHGMPESMNLGDITKVDETKLPKDIDLITYGFPCQDISIAGLQKGMVNEDGTHTRSGLFFEALRIIKGTMPEVAIAENVKNLTGRRFKEQFKTVLDSLEQAGYNNYWKVLNLKDFGIPQNRERVFIVSIRKDVDTGLFRFPQGFPLKLRLKDVMEDEVDEKYYISKAALDGFMAHKERNRANGNGFGFQVKNGDDVATTIRARYYKDGAECLVQSEATDKIIRVYTLNSSQDGVVVSAEGIAKTNTAGHNNTPKVLVSEPIVKQIGNCCHDKGNPQSGRVYDTDGISPTLNTMGGGNKQPFVLVAAAMRGRYNESGSTEQRIEVSDRECANTITSAQKDSMVATNMRIRKLTPKECFRLMGFDDADYEKASAANSNTQLYKQAGNSIGVPVVQYIIKELVLAKVMDGEEE